MKSEKIVMIAVSEKIRDALKVRAAEEKRSIKEIIEMLIEKYLKGEIKWN